MNRIEEIKKLAKGVLLYSGNREIRDQKIDKIIDLCNQEPEEKVIVNPVEDWSIDNINHASALINERVHGNIRIDEYFKAIQEILTTPKEPALWVLWYNNWEIVNFQHFLDTGIGYDHAYKTTNAKIKEVGIYVKDWQALADKGEL